MKASRRDVDKWETVKIACLSRGKIDVLSAKSELF